MKERFTDDLHLSKKGREQLEVVNGIIEEYAAEGYTLTLRQLYYQLVSKDIIPNPYRAFRSIDRISRRR